MKKYSGYTLISKACESGYTLIEVLVSLTIIGLLFGFGFVSFRDFSRREHLTSVARSIKGEMRLIQSKASAGEKPDDVNCNGANTLSSYSFQIVSATSYQIIANCLGGSVVIKSASLADDISMASSQNTISFKVLGQGTDIPQGADAIITFTQAGTNNVTIVTVTSGGEIK